jgi:NDP-sugar pyrophosphorylase family protein
MVQFAVDALVASGLAPRRVVINSSHLAERMVQGLGQLAWGGLPYQVSDESALLLGSGGGLRKALDLVGTDGPMVLLNADVLCSLDLKALVDTHYRLRHAFGVGLTLAIHRRSPGRGEYRSVLCGPAAGCGSSGGRVLGLGATGTQVPFYAGVAVIEPELLKRLPPGVPLEFVPSILEPSLRDGHAGAHFFEGDWIDIGSPRLWRDAHLQLMEGLETGSLSPLWRRRIELAARRIGDRVWTSVGSENRKSSPETAPSVFIGSANQTPPNGWRSVGPRAVVYGPAPQGVDHLENGIAWEGLIWKG